MQIKIEQETYLWDSCKILFQLNCLFAKINLQRLLIRRTFKAKRMYLAAMLFFLYSGERDNRALLLTLKAKWFATLNNGNNGKQCCVNVFLDRWKNTLQARREFYDLTVPSVAAWSIVHKLLKRSLAWTKPERVLRGLLWALRPPYLF